MKFKAQIYATFIALILGLAFPLAGLAQDADGDLMPDAWENTYGCMKANTVDDAADYDSDTLNNLTEYNLTSNPCSNDTDGDSIPDSYEALHACLIINVYDYFGDPDGDGSYNCDEYLSFGTDPCNPDTDGDFMSDGIEDSPVNKWCLDSLVGDSLGDPDLDGINNIDEVNQSRNPCTNDEDSDGMPDAYEDAHACLDWHRADWLEDPDGDDLINIVEWHDYDTDPCDADTDAL